MEQDDTPDKVEWERTVRKVDSSLHAVLAAHARERAKPKRFSLHPTRGLKTLKPKPNDKPLPSGY